ncbi:inositol-tetrakisphosphate 1-kinase-like isoform X2 [Photinus pyralis]|uniref:Inositol-tetrakisphosphate 1-kinase n=2 Tax=Photinus pyralis TaxID=7054 RepID=A0A1Y1L2D3_PHOPY|nr:inositol-tetrakisphosphate 1-kinase-like isoform X2 [Photinus pyralis]
MFGKKRIAYWVSEKKMKKLNWFEFEGVCNNFGYELFKLDLESDLESQGGFNVLLHKLTDTIALANNGDEKCSNTIRLIETYISRHPELVVIDPIPNVRQLLDRYMAYSIIAATDLYKYDVFTPTFCEIVTNSKEETEVQLKNHNVRFPFICKHVLGHGSKQAHEMVIVFNKDSLDACKSPCVVQTFINHNATLYKIFIVGEQYYYIERPSLKNFYPCNEKPIFFYSSDVSKADSTSSLSVLDKEDEVIRRSSPDPNIMGKIASTIRKAFNMDLLGIDVVIENFTGKYAIIDVNAYPGYDGFPNFFYALLELIKEKEAKRDLKIKSVIDRN